MNMSLDAKDNNEHELSHDGSYTSSAATATIRQMEERTAHRMVAGQAITDMSSAIKELVDNALDAKAKTITIRLVSFADTKHPPGIDLIEVSGKLSDDISEH
jgi:hypothetical protein